MKIEAEYKKMLEAIVDDYNKKWIEAGGNHPITEAEAIEILIEDAYNELKGYDYNWNEICSQRKE